MKPYQERVVEEKKELDKKTAALSAFLDDDNSTQIVPPDEWERMSRQQKIMVQYSMVLGERIENFKD
jgi:hypothetical protein